MAVRTTRAPRDDATPVSDDGSVSFCLSEQKSELHLLDKVIVVLALVLGVGDPRQASIAQQSLIRVLAEGLRPAPGHGVQPFQGLPGCSEEKAPLWLERARHLLDDERLRCRVE